MTQRTTQPPLGPDPFDYIHRRIDELHHHVGELRNNSTPTVPVYDYNSLPPDPVEGQQAIITNVPDPSRQMSGSSSASIAPGETKFQWVLDSDDYGWLDYTVYGLTDPVFTQVGTYSVIAETAAGGTHAGAQAEIKFHVSSRYPDLQRNFSLDPYIREHIHLTFTAKAGQFMWFSITHNIGTTELFNFHWSLQRIS